jgi:hypothetical protein
MINAPDQDFSPPLGLSDHDAEAAFHEHILRKAAAARERYGPCIGPEQIVALLHDPDIVRYPATLAFDTAFLEPGEFGWPKPLGFHPRDGFCVILHPCFQTEREAWPLLIAYLIPTINYGDLAQDQHAELFVATLLGLEPAACYERLCTLCDSIPPPHQAGAEFGSAACRPELSLRNPSLPHSTPPHLTPCPAAHPAHSAH